jgi:hypothetical protein
MSADSETTRGHRPVGRPRTRSRRSRGRGLLVCARIDRRLKRLRGCSPARGSGPQSLLTSGKLRRWSRGCWAPHSELAYPQGWPTRARARARTWWWVRSRAVRRSRVRVGGGVLFSADGESQSMLHGLGLPGCKPGLGESGPLGRFLAQLCVLAGVPTGQDAPGERCSLSRSWLRRPGAGQAQSVGEPHQMDEDVRDLLADVLGAFRS